jgi:general secretion pathway protein F
MPAYSFEALDANGSARKGTIEADTAKAARGLLRAQLLVPMVVEPVGPGAAGAGTAGGGTQGTTLWTSRVFNATALAIWTRQIAGLVASGLPLERALTALAEEADDERQRHLVAAIRAEVNGGTPFATALAQHPREFAPTYCAVVGAAVGLAAACGAM